MSPDYDVQITGSTGTPVLLMAGGASSSHGFFPGLVEALKDNWVISLDRPGTGRAYGRGTATLPSGAAAAADAITQLGAGPAVIVGQSLGGAVALQLATDHPELVAGMVLVDPTPFNEPSSCRMAKTVFSVVAAPGRLPVVGARLNDVLWKAMAKKTPVAPGAESGLDVMLTSATLHATGQAVEHLVEEGAALTPRLRHLDVPVALITADRKPDHKVRLAHEQIAEAVGARIVGWPGAVHAEHLRNPEQVNELVLSVLAESQVSTS